MLYSQGRMQNTVEENIKKETILENVTQNEVN